MIEHELAALQGYIITQEPVHIDQKTFTLKLEEESSTSFILNLKIKEKDRGQEQLVKFKIGLEQHKETTKTTSHTPTKPHFQIDYYKREERKGSRAYFTLEITDKQHLIDCIKGTLVIIKEVLEACANTYNDQRILHTIIYADSITQELTKHKKTLIDALHESFRHKQLIIKINGESHLLTTKHQLQKYLDKEETQHIYLPLLQKIEEQPPQPF